MKAIMKSEEIKTITTHYIDGAFVESHGREIMDVIKPTNGQVTADARRRGRYAVRYCRG